MDWTDFISSFGQAADPATAVLNPLESAIKSIAGLFGRGRREADIIVPVQNQYGNVLQQINAQMADPSLSVYQLQQMQLIVAQGYGKFDAFTRDPRFTDGRASHQARDTIRPLVDGKNDAGTIVRADGGTLGNLQALITAKGGGVLPQLAGTIPIGTTPSGPTATIVGTTPTTPPAVLAGNNGLLIAAGLAALFVLKK